jgi:hypothetical protein
MRLELKTDLDDIEGSDNESNGQIKLIPVPLLKEDQGQQYLETSPAIPPAATTWTFEP